MRLGFFGMAASMFVVAGWAFPITAQLETFPPEYEVELVARARPDEYFFGVGDTRNNYVGKDFDYDECAELGAIAKVNQSYIWGMAGTRDNLWLGTLGNPVAGAQYLGTNVPPRISWSMVSESGLSHYGKVHGLLPGFGDWRPPMILRYRLADGELEDLTPLLPPADLSRLHQTEGLRSGGATPPTARNPDEMVVLAGPYIYAGMSDEALYGTGIMLFVFNGTTGEFLGSRRLVAYDNIRRWVEVNGDLYAAVGVDDNLRGAVIRWINDPAHPAYPFAIERVGNLGQHGVDIAFHEGRLFVTTWSGALSSIIDPSGIEPVNALQMHPGLWMGPVVPASGLTAAHRGDWHMVWNVLHYEPDPVVAISYGGGALHSFDGWLYFGTMNLEVGGMALAVAHGLNPRDPVVAANALRLSSLFRGKDFRVPRRTMAGTLARPGGRFELLYGDAELPVYDADSKTFQMRPNRMGATPLMGPSGYYRGDGARNIYTYVMNVYRGDLYIGTRDPRFFPEPPSQGVPLGTFGADLYVLHSSFSPSLVPVSRTGLGNPANYGFRTGVVTDDGLYIGTANPHNMLGHPEVNGFVGGWELIRLERRALPPNDFDGDGVSDVSLLDATGMGVVRFSDTGQSQAFPRGRRGAVPVVGDFDGDWVSDPAWYHPRTGAWTVFSSSRGWEEIEPRPLLRERHGIPLAADLDGDGMDDRIVYVPATGLTRWTLSSDRTLHKARRRYPQRRIVAGHFDDASRARLGWYDPSAGILSFEGGEHLSLTPEWPDSVPLAADTTGNGIDELLLFDRDGGRYAAFDLRYGVATLLWTVEPPTDLILPLMPVIGDFDGDGRVDWGWVSPGDRRALAMLSAENNTQPANNQIVELPLPEGVDTISGTVGNWAAVPHERITTPIRAPLTPPTPARRFVRR